VELFKIISLPRCLLLLLLLLLLLSSSSSSSSEPIVRIRDECDPRPAQAY
jgi:hypothetical protein